MLQRITVKTTNHLFTMTKDKYKKNCQKIKKFIKNLGNCKYSYQEMYVIGNQIMCHYKTTSTFKRICRYIQSECVLSFDNLDSQNVCKRNTTSNFKSNNNKNICEESEVEKQNRKNSVYNIFIHERNNDQINKSVSKLLHFVTYTRKWLDFVKILQKIFYAIIYKANKKFECTENILDLFFYENYKIQIVTVKETIYKAIKILINEKYDQKNDDTDFIYDSLIFNVLNVFENFNEHKNIFKSLNDDIIQIYIKILNENAFRYFNGKKTTNELAKHNRNDDTKFLITIYNFLEKQRKIKYLEKGFYKIEKKVLENVLKNLEFNIDVYEQERECAILFHFYFTCNLKYKFYKIIENQMCKICKKNEDNNEWTTQNCVYVLNESKKLFEHLIKETNSNEEVKRYLKQKIHVFVYKHCVVLSKKLNEMIDNELKCNINAATNITDNTAILINKTNNDCEKNNSNNSHTAYDITDNTAILINKMNNDCEKNRSYNNATVNNKVTITNNKCKQNYKNITNEMFMCNENNIIVYFLSFLYEKNTFYDEYYKCLAKRLLFYQSNKENEKLLCKMFVNEINFVNKIEKMIEDYKKISFGNVHSKYRSNNNSNIDLRLKETMKKQYTINTNYNDLVCDVFLLNKHYWPEIVTCDFEIENVMQEYKNNFEEVFAKSFVRYNFTWLYSISTCEVEINGVTFLMTMIQYEIIKLINENKTFEEIKKHFRNKTDNLGEITNFDIESNLKGIEKIIKFDGNTIDIKSMNNNNDKRAIINCLPDEIEFKLNEIQQINDAKSKHYMNSKIDAKIMKEVKAKKRVSKSEIIQKVKQDLNINANETNERIKHLKENDFVEENDDFLTFL